MLIVDRGNFSIHSLEPKEYFENPQFYLDSFDKIAKSIHINPFSYDESDFFDKHPINSFLYVKENNKIVAILYSSPHRDYKCYKEYGTGNLEHWGNNYIQVHKNYAGKGYGYLLTLACFEDIKRKGGKMVDFMPNRLSAGLIHHATLDNDIGDISTDTDLSLEKLTIKFNDKFFNSKCSLLQKSETYAKHKHEALKPDRDYYDYYFHKKFYNYEPILDK